MIKFLCTAAGALLVPRDAWGIKKHIQERKIAYEKKKINPLQAPSL